MENDPLIGQQLGHYHIQSKLGEGGMARVYRAYHTRLKREVAIKVILSQIADQQVFNAKFILKLNSCRSLRLCCLGRLHCHALQLTWLVPSARESIKQAS